jgi:hypothetical protein
LIGMFDIGMPVNFDVGGATVTLTPYETAFRLKRDPLAGPAGSPAHAMATYTPPAPD